MNEFRTESVDILMPLIRERLHAGQSVRFSPTGISMLPMLRQGRDSVVLSAVSGRLRKFDLPLYQRDNGSYALHRVVKVGESYTCVGDNQFALEHGIRDDQLIAVVTAFYRDDKLHSVNEPLYWLYCRLWHSSRRLRYFLRRVRNRFHRHKLG